LLGILLPQTLDFESIAGVVIGVLHHVQQGAAHRRRLRTGKPELHQIEFVDKCVDHAHRVARIHVVVEALRRRNRAQIERALADADAGIARLVKALAKDIMTEDEVAHEMCPLRADQDRLKGELALAAEDTAPAPCTLRR